MTRLTPHLQDAPKTSQYKCEACGGHIYTLDGETSLQYDKHLQDIRTRYYQNEGRCLCLGCAFIIYLQDQRKENCDG